RISPEKGGIDETTFCIADLEKVLEIGVNDREGQVDPVDIGNDAAEGQQPYANPDGRRHFRARAVLIVTIDIRHGSDLAPPFFAGREMRLDHVRVELRPATGLVAHLEISLV